LVTGFTSLQQQINNIINVQDGILPINQKTARSKADPKISRENDESKAGRILASALP
jgi:hypothetical protein